MTDSMEYNGWTNRETWALNLWLRNDQGLYEMTLDRVAVAMASHIRTDNPDTWTVLLRRRAAGEVIAEWVSELLDPEEQLMTPENIITILSDVGSLYRVNWDELGSSFLDSIEED